MNLSLISRFSQHKVAANLLMLIMIISGFWGLLQINYQFLPSFDIPKINVTVVWQGANPEDITESIVNPLEQKLRYIDRLSDIQSSTRQGSTTISMEFEDGANLSRAKDDIQQVLNEANMLPKDAEPPIITIIEHKELIAKLLITQSGLPHELRKVAQELRSDLLDQGIAKVSLEGIPDLELAITVPATTLANSICHCKS